jgi:hypothetical protein
MFFSFDQAPVKKRSTAARRRSMRGARGLRAVRRPFASRPLDVTPFGVTPFGDPLVIRRSNS